MINLVYLGAAVMVSLAVSLAMLLRHRRPRSVEYGMEEFARELQALAPGSPGTGRRRRR